MFINMTQSVRKRQKMMEWRRERERARERNKTGASHVLKSQTVRLNCCFSANKYWQGFLLALWLSKSLSAVSLSPTLLLPALYLSMKKGGHWLEMIAVGTPAALGGSEEELKDRQRSLMSSGAASGHVVLWCILKSLKKKNANTGLSFRSRNMKDGDTGEVRG